MEKMKENYEAPVCNIVQIEPAGVICVSGINENFEEEYYHW